MALQCEQTILDMNYSVLCERVMMTTHPVDETMLYPLFSFSSFFKMTSTVPVCNHDAIHTNSTTMNGLLFRLFLTLNIQKNMFQEIASFHNPSNRYEKNCSCKLIIAQIWTYFNGNYLHGNKIFFNSYQNKWNETIHFYSKYHSLSWKQQHIDNVILWQSGFVIKLTKQILHILVIWWTSAVYPQYVNVGFTIFIFTIYTNLLIQWRKKITTTTALLS